MQWRQRSLGEVRLERLYHHRSRTTPRHRLNPPAQIIQQTVAYLASVGNHRHVGQTILRYRKIDRRLRTTLKCSEWLRMHDPDDGRPSSQVVDHRGSNRLSAEVEFGGLLVDQADPTLRGCRSIGKAPARDQLDSH